MNKILPTILAFAASSLIGASHTPNNYPAKNVKGVTPGYYLGFNALADEMRHLNRPAGIPEADNFFKSIYFDFHFANQEFNGNFYGNDANHSIENDIFGITLGFGLGDNPNLDIKIPLSVSRFEVGHVDDTGFIGGIELFPNYRINEYVAWGVNFSYLESTSDFPMFDESMTSVSFEAMAESNPAYGMNWSGRVSMGHYYPSNDANDESFWLFKGALALHYQLHENFTFLPFFRANIGLDEEVLTDSLWVDYGVEFILMPNSPWNFSLGIAGVGGHDVIEEGMEFYISSKGNF